MRLALAQLNPTVGDVAANTALVLDAIETARRDGADVLLTPELALLGYPPRDLLLRAGVVEACERAVEMIARASGDLTVIVGSPRRADDGLRGVRNSAFVCRAGAIEAVCDKQLLPGYDVFDEDRYFDPGTRSVAATIGGRRCGIVICEDLWRAGDVLSDPHSHYAADPVAGIGACDVILSLNASPFVLGKHERHLDLLRSAARRIGAPVAAVNQIGANDDLVFDGRSVLVGADGALLAQLPGWRSAVVTVDLDAPATPAPAGPHGDDADLYHALVLAIRDYLDKTRHATALIGVSGGIDSALTATLAVAALGPERVRTIAMPSRYSADISHTDAAELARRLGLAGMDTLPIEPAHTALRSTLEDAGLGPVAGVADENIQARIRGLLLMARANQTGALVLATGNKSEYAVGYSTLYGDMCGALAVLGDVLKTRVYALARWINANASALGFAGPPIPERTIDRPPSAELRPDQTDQDTLPPYDVLDDVIERVVDGDESVDRVLAETAHPAELVETVLRMIDRAEYKRFQAAIIPKVTPRAFGRGRPMPLVMRSRVDADATPSGAADEAAESRRG